MISVGVCLDFRIVLVFWDMVAFLARNLVIYKADM